MADRIKLDWRGLALGLVCWGAATLMGVFWICEALIWCGVSEIKGQAMSIAILFFAPTVGLALSQLALLAVRIGALCALALVRHWRRR